MIQFKGKERGGKSNREKEKIIKQMGKWTVEKSEEEERGAMEVRMRGK